MHLKRPALALCGILFFCSLLCIRIGPRAATGEGEDASGGPDAAVKDFQFAELEAWLKTTPPGVERDYFSGVLANREGRTEESIHLLANVLPSIRVTQPRRAAVALEALADDYDKSFRYKEAALTDNDLLKNFALYLDPKKLQGTKDDAALMHY